MPPMANLGDVQQLARDLPGVVEDGPRFLVAGKAFAWPWLERVHPKEARVANLDVYVVRVPSEEAKLEMAATEPEIFFTEPHYDGYPAIMVRLAAVPVARLRELLAESWRLRAPAALLAREGPAGPDPDHPDR
jgi:hypothetical protein